MRISSPISSLSSEQRWDTTDARTEAQRDGAPPIDLIDGEALVEKLKELRIGVQIKERVVEEVFIDEAYFQNV
jgi:restriction system protein